jgi:hypothetical protein
VLNEKSTAFMACYWDEFYAASGVTKSHSKQRKFIPVALYLFYSGSNIHKQYGLKEISDEPINA